MNETVNVKQNLKIHGALNKVAPAPSQKLNSDLELTDPYGYDFKVDSKRINDIGEVYVMEPDRSRNGGLNYSASNSTLQAEGGKRTTDSINQEEDEYQTRTRQKSLGTEYGEAQTNSELPLIMKEGQEAFYANNEVNQQGRPKKKKKKAPSNLTGGVKKAEDHALLNGEKPLTVQALNFMFQDRQDEFEFAVERPDWKYPQHIKIEKSKSYKK